MHCASIQDVSLMLTKVDLQAGVEMVRSGGFAASVFFLESFMQMTLGVLRIAAQPMLQEPNWKCMRGRNRAAGG